MPVAPSPAVHVRRRLLLPVIASAMVGALVVFAWLSLLPTVGPTTAGDTWARNLLVLGAYLAVAALASLRVTWWLEAPVRRPYDEGRPATPAEQRRAVAMPWLHARQNLVCWTGAAVLFAWLDVASGNTAPDAARTAAGILVGGVVTSALVYLLVERGYRPVVVAFLAGGEPPVLAVPAVRTRLVVAWLLGSAVPLGLLLALLANDPQPRAQAARSMALLAGAAILAGGLLTDAAARSVADPLAEVRRALGRLEAGDLTATVPVDHAGEVGMLLAAFNRTVASLRDLEARNARLTAELAERLDDVKASRRRLVATADEVRRRVERDLHDGAQQRLLAAIMSLQLAQRALDAGDRQAAEHLARVDRELRGAMVDLRELARGIYPPVLVEAGLGAAMHALADRAAVPVQVEQVPGTRLPEALEAAAYFVVSEAIANAAKHAGAAHVRVSARLEDGALVAVVADDGAGGARLVPGGGLQGLEDRVAAEGGRLEVRDGAAGGSVVEARLPLRRP